MGYNEMIPYYRKLVDSYKVDSSDKVRNAITLVKKGEAVYREIERKTGCPWQIVGAIHYRESTCNMDRHLHNGDPLSRRTVRIPSGRPVDGEPPFTFSESAVDALKYYNFDFKGYHGIDKIIRFCYVAESYNGFGYYNRGVVSPYLWSGSNNYQRGKYVHDGVYDPNAVDYQCGVLPIVMELGLFEEGKDMTFKFTRNGYIYGEKVVEVEIDTVSDLLKVLLESGVNYDTPVGFSMEDVPSLPKKDYGNHPTLQKGDKGDFVKICQRELNVALEIAKLPELIVDGDFGTRTENSVCWFQRVSNSHLSVDGVVGPNTWKALETPENITISGGISREALVQTARSQLGVRESNNGHHLYTESFVSLLGTKEFSWCSAFVCWVLEKCGVNVDRHPNGYTYTLALVNEFKKWAMNNNRYYTDTSKIRHGDIVIFDWQGKNGGFADHIGFFDKKVNGKFVCVEGNVSDQVLVKERPDSLIAGFISVDGLTEIL